jgi:membrane-associated phospholipid phosphatase
LVAIGVTLTRLVFVRGLRKDWDALALFHPSRRPGSVSPRTTLTPGKPLLDAEVPGLSPPRTDIELGRTQADASHANRRLALCFLPIPLLIAASRIYVAAHYLSDVICAAIIGILCAWLCVRACLKSQAVRES